MVPLLVTAFRVCLGTEAPIFAPDITSWKVLLKDTPITGFHHHETLCQGLWGMQNTSLGGMVSSEFTDSSPLFALTTSCRRGSR